MFSMLLLSFVITACLKKDEDDPKKSKKKTTAKYACTYYEDFSTYSYFECVNFKGSAMSVAEIADFCEQQNDGKLSVECTVNYFGAIDSTGVCTYDLNTNTVKGRWYYSVVGNGPSETAICSSLTGTWQAD